MNEMYKTQLVISLASSPTWRELLKSLLSTSRESWTSSFQPSLCSCVLKIMILVGIFLSRRRTFLSMFFKHGTDFTYAQVSLRKMAVLSHLWPSLIFLDMNNLDTLLCHSLSCRSSVLVFTFHLKFYYLWVHWLLLLSSQKCFKSSASTFFSLLHILRLYLAIILLWNQDGKSVYGFNRPTSANLYFKTLTKPYTLILLVHRLFFPFFPLQIQCIQPC